MPMARPYPSTVSPRALKLNFVAPTPMSGQNLDPFKVTPTYLFSSELHPSDQVIRWGPRDPWTAEFHFGLSAIAAARGHLPRVRNHPGGGVKIAKAQELPSLVPTFKEAGSMEY